MDCSCIKYVRFSPNALHDPKNVSSDEFPKRRKLESETSEALKEIEEG